MSTKLEAPLATARIADRVRLEREARGWTLAALAERAGVSRAMISKIERHEASPTAAVLIRLASAFDLTMAAFFARVEDDHDRLVRAADQSAWRDPATGYVRKQLFEHPEHPLELVRVELPPHARVGMPAVSYLRIRQVVWVLEGALVIDEAGTRNELRAGDCLGFGPPADITFTNETDATCTYVVALTRS